MSLMWGACLNVPFDHLESVIALLRDDGHTVSIDSADYDDLRRGVAAGASYILSLHEGTVAQAHEDGLDSSSHAHSHSASG